MTRQVYRRDKGFTLLEILLAIAIFALGGVAILSLFLAQATRAKHAADANRAIEIAATVRSTLEAALNSPPRVIGQANAARFLYPVAFPFASLTNQSPRYGANKMGDGDSPVPHREFDTAQVPTWFLELPKQPFQGDGDRVRRGETVMFFPSDLKDINGNAMSSPSIGADPGGLSRDDLRVFYWKPEITSLIAKEKLGSRLDTDDSDIYAFNFRVDRSVSRSDLPNPAGGAEKMLLPGLYVVRLRVFRGYDPEPGARNVPVQEFEFTIATTE